MRETSESDVLLDLMWKCHCAASDGVPVPFNRWLMDEGPWALPGEIQELREGYDTACEQWDLATGTVEKRTDVR